METEGKDNDANDPDYLIDLIARLSVSLSLSLSLSPSLSLTFSLFQRRDRKEWYSLSLYLSLWAKMFALSYCFWKFFFVFAMFFLVIWHIYFYKSTLWEMTLNANGKHWVTFLEQLRFKWQTLASQCLYNVCIIN